MRVKCLGNYAACSAKDIVLELLERIIGADGARPDMPLNLLGEAIGALRALKDGRRALAYGGRSGGAWCPLLRRIKRF